MCCKIPSQQKPAEDASLTEIWLKKRENLLCRSVRKHLNIPEKLKAFIRFLFAWSLTLRGSLWKKKNAGGIFPEFVFIVENILCGK